MGVSNHASEQCFETSALLDLDTMSKRQTSLILPRHNKLYTAIFLFKKNCAFCNSHYLVSHTEWRISIIQQMDWTVSTETVFSWRKDESYSQYNQPHLNHKVWKQCFKACVRPLRWHAVAAHKILMFRTVQIQTLWEIHSSLSHTMIWVKMRAHFSQNGASFSVLQLRIRLLFFITDIITNYLYVYVPDNRYAEPIFIYCYKVNK